MPVIIDGTNGLTFPDNSRQYNGYFGFKNRIINGDMRIDQRNNGASVTPINGQYTLDRYAALLTQASKFTVQRNAGSVTPPAGFSNYLGMTVGASANVTVSAGDFFGLYQWIEGFNIADLAWGTASAAPVTVSFWARSSVTGTFGAALQGITSSYRSYPFTYTISAANTWEQKTITIPGDTSSPTGGWPSNNSAGLLVTFSLGAGATYLGTAGAWNSNNHLGATGQTNIITTNGATLYITGVQLEEGVVSTNFDVLPYTTQLQLCQRYYFKIGPAASGERVGVGYAASAVLSDTLFVFPVIMRTAPTALEQTGTAGDYAVQQAAGATACSAVPTFQAATNQTATTRQTVASGLTTGQGNFVRLQTTSGYFAWSAEL